MRLELPGNNLSHPMICEHSSYKFKLIHGLIHRREGKDHTQCNSLFEPIPKVDLGSDKTPGDMFIGGRQNAAQLILPGSHISHPHISTNKQTNSTNNHTNQDKNNKQIKQKDRMRVNTQPSIWKTHLYLPFVCSKQTPYRKQIHRPSQTPFLLRKYSSCMQFLTKRMVSCQSRVERT